MGALVATPSPCCDTPMPISRVGIQRSLLWVLFSAIFSLAAPVGHSGKKRPARSPPTWVQCGLSRPALCPHGPQPLAALDRTKNGITVRSKSAVIVADTLEGRGINYGYEKPLSKPGKLRNFRLSDFRGGYQGDVYYREHIGMLDVPAYRDASEEKLAWYKTTGFFDQLITSEDAPNGGIDAGAIQRLARTRILGE